MTETSNTPESVEQEGTPQGNQPVDITDKHFDPHATEGGAWVADENPTTSKTEDHDSETPEAPGDQLAETRAEDHNENATEGR